MVPGKQSVSSRTRTASGLGDMMEGLRGDGRKVVGLPCLSSFLFPLPSKREREREQRGNSVKLLLLFFFFFSSSSLVFNDQARLNQP